MDYVTNSIILGSSLCISCITCNYFYLSVKLSWYPSCICWKSHYSFWRSFYASLLALACCSCYYKTCIWSSFSLSICCTSNALSMVAEAYAPVIWDNLVIFSIGLMIVSCQRMSNFYASWERKLSNFLFFLCLLTTPYAADYKIHQEEKFPLFWA